MIEADLASGKLVKLDMPDNISWDHVMDAIYRTDTPPGPAGSWLIERFRGQADASTRIISK
jgi:hypothetical protein